MILSWRRQTFGLLTVLVVAGLVFALPAGRRPFWSSDEPRFAVLALDILDAGGGGDSTHATGRGGRRVS